MLKQKLALVSISPTTFQARLGSLAIAGTYHIEWLHDIPTVYVDCVYTYVKGQQRAIKTPYSAIADAIWLASNHEAWLDERHNQASAYEG